MLLAASGAVPLAARSRLLAVSCGLVLAAAAPAGPLLRGPWVPPFSALSLLRVPWVLLRVNTHDCLTRMLKGFFSTVFFPSFLRVGCIG